MVECSVDTEKSYSQAEKQTMGGIIHISIQIKHVGHLRSDPG